MASGAHITLIYDNNMPFYQIHEVLYRYSSSLALMRNVFRSSHRTCMSTKSSLPLKLIYQDDRRAQFQAATLLSRAADDIDVEAAGDNLYKPRTKATVFFVTGTLTLTTVLVDFQCTVWRLGVSSKPSVLNRRSRSVGDVNAAASRRGVDRRRARHTSRGTQARPGVI
ncbi:hypothetical protein K525DRAFT_271453 [Schizophyllum commune Loenen D]|nr:hypothetical protein K525DRAFT_271453 [Schizophyllum commune Loenen D]